MNPALHYLVKAKLIRYRSADHIEFVELHKPFYAQRPIEARSEAFRYYQNYLEVLLQSLGAAYTTDREARERLLPLIETGTHTELSIGEAVLPLNDSWDNGLGVYMVVDKPLEALGDEAGAEVLLHGIGNRDCAEDPQKLMDGLNREYWYYEGYGFESEGKVVSVPFYEEDMGRTELNTVLPTPFDWSGCTAPTEKKQENRTEVLGITLEEIMRGGEGNQVEFKPTLHYNFKTGAAAIGIKAIIARTICAFLNANGGYLFIGLSDSGQVQGLDYDYSLAGGKNPKDYFLLQFDDTLQQFLPPGLKPLVLGSFYEVEDREVFVVAVQPARRGPVFLRGQWGKEFYVRWNASTRQYTDVEDIVTYCLNHWNKPLQP